MRSLMEQEIFCVNGALLLSEMKPSESSIARPWKMEEKINRVIVKPPILILPDSSPIVIQ